MASYAPLFAKKGLTQWKTEMIFFDIVKICSTPNLYVQKLFSTKQSYIYFNNVISKDEKDTMLATSGVQDSKTCDIILKLVNAGKESKSIKIDQSGFSKIVSDAEQTVLTGDADAENTFENPQKVVPIKSTSSVRKTSEYETPAMSLTVIRMKTRI